MRPARLGPVLLLAGALLCRGPWAGADIAAPSSHPPKAEETDGPDEILGRMRLYADQHGDRGHIDAERRLRTIREEYERRRARQAGVNPLGIGGTRWISLGPTNGAGRMTSLAPHPTLAGTVYVGAAGGGVWKTENGGATWRPLTEDLADLSVGALALAPSSPNTIYLGTGEGGFGNFIPGIGLLTSNDGGATWSLPVTVIARSFFRISVHPTRPQELVAGTENGGIRSTDGGRNWSFVIPQSTYGAVTEIARAPGNADLLYAATWCVFGCNVGASRILKSTDGGVTWTSKSAGLPITVDDPFFERFSLAMSPSNPQVLYVAAGLSNFAGNRVSSHVYKSVDGGESWVDLDSVHNSPDGSIAGFMGLQSWYDNTIVVSPGDPNAVVAGGVEAVRSTDGGASWSAIFQPDFHVDQHDLQYQGSTLWIANDGGIWTSTDDGASVVGHNAGLVTRQYYALSNDLANRNRVIAGSQDNGTGQRADAGGTEWRDVLGADGFDCAVSPTAPNIAYATIQRGRIFRSKDAGAASPVFGGISPPYDANEDRPFRTILALAQGVPTTIYTGSSRVWRSRDAGDTWMPLPTATVDGAVWSNGTVSAIAVAPSDPEVLWVAKGNAVYRSINGGQTWRGAGAGLAFAYVNGIEIDPRDPSVAYIASASTLGSSVYRTADGGSHWEPRAGGLPHFAALVVRIDPTDPNILFCGTDVGVFRSTDQGGNWSRFGTDLPAASVQDLRISEDASILRIATYGRGAWELEVPPPANHPPLAALVAPGGSATVALGATVGFESRITDSDAGDALTGVWTFTDTWETSRTIRGEAALPHTFHRIGVFPVTLTARDGSGAISSSFITITVPEEADACERAFVLPGAGPFPATVLLNNESATTQTSDPTPACMPFEGSGIFGSVWLDFTPASSDFFEISTCGSTTDAVLSTFTGPACGPYAPVANGCNDDAPAFAACAPPASLVTVFAEAGQAIRIQLTGFFARDVSTIPVTVRPASSTAAPRVTGINTCFGDSRGGTGLILSGDNFASGATVLVGGVPASNVEVLAPTSLTAITLPHAAGPVDVVVQNSDGSTGWLLSAFTFVDGTQGGPCGNGGPDCPNSSPRVIPFRN